MRQSVMTENVRAEDCEWELKHAVNLTWVWHAGVASHAKLEQLVHLSAVRLSVVHLSVCR
jgi:hypothetical protein